ncbi:hypothetical protein [Pseudarthrobacter sp. NamE2]|uniref:TOTE conflict system archaeo-eukaryotic primase domain-containing protein n=1 Tax=Pseudarthrobacter sp. NamE2 TaxID=2576838 RepID=UPI0014859412|nr:hypothetical protein [Pseudarthrobacter sp. NamE2]
MPADLPRTGNELCYGLRAHIDPRSLNDGFAKAVGLSVSRPRFQSTRRLRPRAPYIRSATRQLGTDLIHDAMALPGSMSLASYDWLFPAQDVQSGKGMANLLAAPLNGKRRQRGTTLVQTLDQP